MQKNTIATKNYTLTFTKEIGKLITVGCPNYVLDLLAGEEKQLEIDLWIAAERVELPDFVEFERVDTGSLSAKYHVNNCLEKTQREAWVSNAVMAFLKEYPAFAYIRKK